MSEGAPTRMRIPRSVVALGCALLLGAAVGLFAMSERNASRTPPVAGTPDAASAVSKLEKVRTEVAAKAPGTPAAETASDGATATLEERPAAPAVTVEPHAPAAPSVDVVRVQRNGQALVAGRAEPGARVAIMTENRVVAETEADRSGDFVAIFRAEPSSEPQALSLETTDAQGRMSVSDDVVLLLPDAVEAPPAWTESSGTVAEAPGIADIGPDSTGADAGLVEDGAPEPAEAEIAAVAIVRQDGVEPSPLARPIGAGRRDVALASIAYEETGDVALSGFGTAGVRLRAYVDDRFARAGAVGADGRWEIGLDDVEAGLYRLRIDAIAEDGTVESRLETPFQRDFPKPRPGDGGQAGSVVVVQPGTNLWTLARIHYGSGVLYTQIFTANSELIRDPDLIYPGQIFALPVSETGASPQPAETGRPRAR